jgi:PhnB protein
MPHPTPYLAFNGNCAEAMRFYARALDAKLEVLMTNGESPMAAHFPPETADRILHARLVLLGGGVLMAGDCPPNMPYEGIKGVSIALNYDLVAEAERAFKALGENGTVTMPMQPTFWAKAWGMLVDQFGTSWIVNGELLPI